MFSKAIMKTLGSVSALALLCALICGTNTFENAGKHFYLVVGEVPNGLYGTRISLHITTASTMPGKVTVKNSKLVTPTRSVEVPINATDATEINIIRPGLPLKNSPGKFNIAVKNPIYLLGSKRRTIFSVLSVALYLDITSSVPINMYVSVFNDDTPYAETYMAIPNAALSSRYIIPSWSGLEDSLSQFGTYIEQKTAYVELPAGRRVAVDFTADVGTGKTTYIGHKNISFSLDKKRTIQIQSKQDLTGSTIVAEVPIGVVSGNIQTTVGSKIGYFKTANGTFAKHRANRLEEMIPPLETWGKMFLVASIVESESIYRVIASKPGTRVLIAFYKPRCRSGNTCNAPRIHTSSRTIEWSGDFTEVELPVDSYNIVEADEPVMVVQYNKNSLKSNPQAGPFMMTVPPLEQYKNNYQFVAVDNKFIEHHFVSVLVKSDIKDKVYINDDIYGNASMEFPWIDVTFNGTGYSMKTTRILPGAHALYVKNDSLATIGALVYGYGSGIGYGHPAGMRFARLYDYCTNSSTTPADNLDNDCDGKVDEELSNGVDDDGDGKIDEDLAGSVYNYPPYLYGSSKYPIPTPEPTTAAQTTETTPATESTTQEQVQPQDKEKSVSLVLFISAVGGVVTVAIGLSIGGTVYTVKLKKKLARISPDHMGK